MNTSSNTNQNSSNPSGVKVQLKQIGEQIETIAKQLKGTGNQQDIDELYELGDRVEHFCDSMDFSPSAERTDQTALTASRSEVKNAGEASDVTSTRSNQTVQKNQDDEDLDSQKPNPVM